MSQHERDHPITAPEMLCQAHSDMGDRAASRDCPDGERSMGRTVELFNVLFDKSLTETEGWMFMCLLKAVRGAQGDFRADDYIDLAAYAALAGEAAGSAALDKALA